jgi:hypothetical protein
MCPLCAGFAYGINRPRTLGITAEMRVCASEWMRYLVDVYGHLSYTYPQKQTSDEICREMHLALGCTETNELDDEEQDDDDDLLPI